MSGWVALFRGINVGGRNVVRMETLREQFEAQGASAVRSYIQSGNVVFDCAPQTAAKLVKRVVGALAQGLGMEPAVHLISVTELRTAAQRNPFPGAEGEPTTLHLFFLAKLPASGASQALAELAAATESFVLDDSVLYLHAPAGIGRSKLAREAERVLGVTATGRNWRTVTKLLALAGEPQ